MCVKGDDPGNVGSDRPTATAGAATAALNGFIGDGLFIGQSQQFLQFLQQLAAEADAAQRQG